MNFKHTVETLSNGLRVVRVPMATPTVTVLVMVGVGSRHEDESVAGISHFVEHLVFKGTKKYPTAQAVASAVDAVGATFNAFTSKEFTGFYIKAAAAHTELALDMLSEFLWEAMLRAEDIKRERGVIVEEINMYEDTPIRRIGDVFDQLMYAGHSLGRDIIGTKETVTGVEREDFVKHMQEWYQPKKVVLGLAGDKNKVQSSKFKVQSLVEEHFGRKQKGESGAQRARQMKKFENEQKGPQVRVQYKKTEQAHFALGVRSLERGHKDRYVQAVLTTVLGGNMSSRLFSEVREKRGLAYYVRTGSGSFHETGHVVTNAGVKIDKIDEAIKAVREQYHKMKQAYDVTAEELEEAKEYLKGQLMIQLEDSQDVAHMFVDSFLLEGKVRTPKEVIEGVEAVTREDVERLAKRIFVASGLNLAVIGPFQEKGRFERLLKE